MAASDATTMPDKSESRFILTATGPSARGQIASMTRFIDEHSGYIEAFDQYNDPVTRRFFGRIMFRTPRSPEARDELGEQFAEVTRKYDMATAIQGEHDRPKVLIMVSRTDHCLLDLLYRHARGELAMEITAIASNHKDLEPLAAQYGLRYVHLPVNNDTRAQQEQQLSDLIDETGSELVVLARYMQILTDGFVRKLHGRAINIHHSFLPGFKGARPYRQAYDRGVKLIGATAHFVTPDLDEGPIIEQAVERVDHTASVADLTASGRDCECRALSRAVQCYIERRVFLNGERTVVL